MNTITILPTTAAALLLLSSLPSKLRTRPPCAGLLSAAFFLACPTATHPPYSLHIRVVDFHLNLNLSAQLWRKTIYFVARCHHYQRRVFLKAEIPPLPSPRPPAYLQESSLPTPTSILAAQRVAAGGTRVVPWSWCAHMSTASSGLAEWKERKPPSHMHTCAPT